MRYMEMDVRLHCGKRCGSLRGWNSQTPKRLESMKLSFFESGWLKKKGSLSVMTE
jgi:hypothetical protein